MHARRSVTGTPGGKAVKVLTQVRTLLRKPKSTIYQACPRGQLLHPAGAQRTPVGQPVRWWIEAYPVRVRSREGRRPGGNDEADTSLLPVSVAVVAGACAVAGTPLGAMETVPGDTMPEHRRVRLPAGRRLIADADSYSNDDGNRQEHGKDDAEQAPQVVLNRPVRVPEQLPVDHYWFLTVSGPATLGECSSPGQEPVYTTLEAASIQFLMTPWDTSER